MNFKTINKPSLVTKFPEGVNILFEIFGSNIRLVGGCVRDLLLKTAVNDFDFATKFLPQEVIKILRKNNIKALETGVKFGTVTAVVKGQNFEITTLRKDEECDGRHAKVEFVDDYYFDAARRDFTINALFLDQNGVVVDYFDGLTDLQKKQVKFIGDAEKRVAEDYLRILRFFRFSLKYAKKIDEEGLAVCVKNKANLRQLSVERIRQELLKIVAFEKRKKLLKILEILKKEEILTDIFSQNLNLIAIKRLFNFEEELAFEASLKFRLACLFLNVDGDLKLFFKEICATNIEKKYFSLLFNFLNHQIINRKFAKNPQEVAVKNVKLLLLEHDKDWVFDSYLMSQIRNFTFENMAQVKKVKKYLDDFTLPKFPLESQDVIKRGFKGRELGNKLQELKEEWALSDFSLSKNHLLKMLPDV